MISTLLDGASRIAKTILDPTFDPDSVQRHQLEVEYVAAIAALARAMVELAARRERETRS